MLTMNFVAESGKMSGSVSHLCLSSAQYQSYDAVQCISREMLPDIKLQLTDQLQLQSRSRLLLADIELQLIEQVQLPFGLVHACVCMFVCAYMCVCVYVCAEDAITVAPCPLTC